MKFVKVERLPEVNHSRCNAHKNLNEYLNAFMKRNIKVAKVLFRPDEYSTVEAAYICLRRSARAGGYPITVHRRNDALYVVRKDI